MNRCVKNINKTFGELKVLDNVTIEFEDNRVASILGPSGCGKSTLLSIIASVIKADSGSIHGFDSKTMSFVFQEDRLLEWRTVEENIDFVLKDRLPKNERDNLIETYLKMVELYEYKKFYPGKLSGGMRQRVSIARAFAYPSKVLIMDEPFKSLDINTKESLIKCFSEMIKRDKRTVILVTHDIEEAAILSDKIVVMTEKPTKVSSEIVNIIPEEERWYRNEKLDSFVAKIKENTF